MRGSNAEAVEQVYRLARHTDHRALRVLFHDDASWHPAADGAWKPCDNADDVVRTLLWRAHANRLRTGELIELGDRVLVQLRGRRLERLGAKGFIPRLYQIVVLRQGKVASIRDFPSRGAALEAAGIKA